MRLRIHQISLKLDYDKADVLSAIARILDCPGDALGQPSLVRRSIDARRKDVQPKFVLSVEIDYYGVGEPPLAPGRVVLAPEPEEPAPASPVSPPQRPVVVGAGPAGLMAALTLAEADAKPLVIERGQDVHVRSHHVATFWQEGVLNPESNVLYGEGGAGLFSDGKLTTRSKEKGAVRSLLETLVRLGASPDILIDAEPHVGSDMLVHLIPAIRERITELGGTFRFDTRLDGLQIVAGTLRGAITTDDEIRTDALFLASGHSARDTYRMLHAAGVSLAAKPFAIGVRAEMPQSRLNVAQYGKWATHPKLGPATFSLTRKAGTTARACYSFCTCPGGVVMACASAPGFLTSNGMSYSRRAKSLGNAAILVPVGLADFPETPDARELAGMVFQESLEKAAFTAGGGRYSLPAQPLVDFLAERKGSDLPAERSCKRVVPANLVDLLPPAVAETLQLQLPRMLRELNGIRHEDVLLYGIETRSSSPVRIVRDPTTRESISLPGLFPIGEGSGYAGGIVSSALDGIHAAAHWLRGMTA